MRSSCDAEGKTEIVIQLTLWDWSPEDCPKQETGDFDLSQYMNPPEET